MLWNNIHELSKIVEKDQGKTIDKAFTWNGDGKIILAIVQHIEDSINIEKDKSIFEELQMYITYRKFNTVLFYISFSNL